MFRKFLALVVIALLGAAGVAGYHLVASEVEADIYRARLAALASDYSSLRERYDAVIRETAMTELVVKDGALSVSIRSASGELLSLPTELDPSREIYIDYVVRGGRLWIRRVFDAETPPATAVVIDPALADIDWSLEGEAYGKAAYRALDEGRWVVSATGDGSLGLVRVADGETVTLEVPPPVRRFEPIESETRETLGALAPREVLNALVARVRGGA